MMVCVTRHRLRHACHLYLIGTTCHHPVAIGKSLTNLHPLAIALPKRHLLSPESSFVNL